MNKQYVILDKKLGQTPLEAIQQWKAEHPEYKDVPACYAGRLDPMATGLLLVLLGNECKRVKEYTRLDKEYEIEVLLDADSDTGDVLGIVSQTSPHAVPDTKTLQSILWKETGTHLRPYPMFSSKTVAGVPLFLHALRGTIDTIKIPEHEETLHAIKLLSVTSLSSRELRDRVNGMLATAPKTNEPSKELGADFRIDAVQKSWDSILIGSERSFTCIRLRVTCGSGAYMRSLAERIGKSLGTHALALSIRRTKMGIYYSFGSLRFWTHRYRFTTH